MDAELSRTGISVLGDVPWGLHFSLFYQTDEDLLDVIVPYFAAGLEARELCVWAPSAPAVERATMDALRQCVPDFDRLLEEHAFELFCYEDFLKPNGRVDIERALAQWRTWDQRAHDEGFTGLRGSGNLLWVKKDSWGACHEYETALHRLLVGRRITVLCNYPLDATDAGDVLDSAREHHLVIARRHGEWDMLEVPALKRSKDELQRVNAELEQRVQQRSAQLTAANAELRREIDERRRVECELRRTGTYLQHAQRLSHTGGIAGTMAAGRATFWSPEIFRIFGLEPASHPPPFEQALAMIHPADRVRTQTVFDELLRTQGDVELEFRVVRPDGTIRHVRGLASPLPNGSDAPTEFVGSLIDITEQKRATAKLLQVKRAAHAKTLKAQFEATLKERTRLARDIHDTLLQGLTGIALKLRATLPNLGDVPPATAERIRGIVELADSTIRDARRAVWDIRGSGLARDGLASTLEEEVRRRARGVAVEFTMHGEPRRLPAAIEDAILRIGQEAVINATAHANASMISVELAYEPRTVRLTVEDDGRGFAVTSVGSERGGRWGLIGMRERAERVGAPLVIHSTEGVGTRVELTAPTPRTSAGAGTGPRLSRPAIVPHPPVESSDADTRAHG